MGTYVSLEQDPASPRLGPDEVIGIHHMHREGRPWDEIAGEYDTTRKNVQRIVQGRRWKQLHPVVRPDLYNDEAPTERRYTQEELDRAWVAAFEAFKAALGVTHTQV